MKRILLITALALVGQFGLAMGNGSNELKQNDAEKEIIDEFADKFANNVDKLAAKLAFLGTDAVLICGKSIGKIVFLLGELGEEVGKQRCELIMNRTRDRMCREGTQEECEFATEFVRECRRARENLEKSRIAKDQKEV